MHERYHKLIIVYKSGNYTTEKLLLRFCSVISNCIAWTSAWVNQKGYETCSCNITHDGKITFTILFSYQQLYCMDFSLGEPERIYNMFL